MTTKRMISIFQYGFWLSLSYLQTFPIKIGKATSLPEHLGKGNSSSGTPGERQLPFQSTWGKAAPLPEHLGSPSWFRGILGSFVDHCFSSSPFSFSLWNFLSSIIRWTASDYPYGIYKPFCSMSLKLHSNVIFCCWCQFFRLSDCCLTANEHFFSYDMTRTS